MNFIIASYSIADVICICVLITKKNFYVINIESEGIIESTDIAV